MNREQHEMILKITYPSGAEEWHCLTCGRRMTITWQPWKKIILQAGNAFASHSAIKGGLLVDSLQITQNQQDGQPSPEEIAEDPYLAPWQRWLDGTDTDELWDKGI